MHDLIQDILHWEKLYFSGGRLQKPVNILVDRLDTENMNSISLRAATSAALLHIHEGKYDVAIVDDGKLQTETDSGEFWILFGGFAPIGRRVASEDDVIPEATPAKLYSVVDGQIDPLEGELSKGMPENNKCYLLDRGDEIYLWFGRVTQVEESKSACHAADDLLSGQNRPKATRVTRVIQGYESHSFKSYFDSWPAGSVSAGAEEGRGKVAAFLQQQGVDVKGATKGAPVSEEVPPLLAAGGKIEVSFWHIRFGGDSRARFLDSTVDICAWLRLCRGG